MNPADMPLPLPGPVATASRALVTRWRAAADTQGDAGSAAGERLQAQADTDWLAEEVPVALAFNGITHAVMLASPADLEDFALGFALTEGLIDSPADCYGIETQAGCGGITLDMHIAAACAWRLKERRRNLAGRTGCGLCGTDSLAHVQRALPPAPAVHVPPQALATAQQALRQHQQVQQRTGATHAAAWCSLQGQVRLVREDVGRHNALDKLIGALLRPQPGQQLPHGPMSEGFALITSRASFEMVQKAAAAGIGVLVAVSAPTALAVHTAQNLGVALAGFVRGTGGVAYTFAERFGLTALTPPTH
ncbi:MAG: formate dehydrogenase accessory sulfurtransferase FdhD [Pseudomonadota bacterium]|nr:formate dehydrogenase accessory sulfurtransferase FdhD [Pseudomonadota bacterium]